MCVAICRKVISICNGVFESPRRSCNSVSCLIGIRFRIKICNSRKSCVIALCSSITNIFSFSSSAFAGKSLCILIGIISSFPHNAFIPVGLCLRSHTIAYFLFIGNRHHLPSSFIGTISRNSFSVITGTPSFAAVLFLDDVEWLSLLIRYDVFPVTEPVTLPPSCSMRSFN